MEISAEILDRCSHGDVAALGAIFAAYGDRVYRICRNVLDQDSDAEDATQEVFLRVFDKIGGFRQRSRFSTWLYRLAMNHCLNQRRRERRLPAPLSELGGEGAIPAATDPAAGAFEARDAVDHALARLDDTARAVVVLREIEGLSYDEIAEVLEIPIGTVMSRLARAREKLARMLERNGALRA